MIPVDVGLAVGGFLSGCYIAVALIRTLVAFLLRLAS